MEINIKNKKMKNKEENIKGLDMTKNKNVDNF